MIEARWRSPPHFRNGGTWLNAALKSTKVVAVSTAEHHEYRAHAICLRLLKPRAEEAAAAGIPMKIGTAHRLWSSSSRLMGRPGPGARWGDSWFGPGTNSPDPMSPMPTPAMIAGVTAEPANRVGSRARPRAAARYRDHLVSVRKA